MAKIPITITKIKVETKELNWSSEAQPAHTFDSTNYLFTLAEKGQQWERTFVCDRDALLKLRKNIDELLESTTTDEILNITKDQAVVVDEHHKTDPLCKPCLYRLTGNCVTCLFEIDSPLERQLFLELKKKNIQFQIQYGINWQGQNISTKGKSYMHPSNNFKEVLTIVDFYINRGSTSLCIYTDGHTYHERTEEQAQRDRNIDRKLQELGFTVLRYTGKEVNGNISKITDEIQNWLRKAYN